MDVDTIRSQVPALSKFVWFQNGFVSLTPTPIAEEHARLMRELYENGPMHLLHPDVEVPRRAASVDRIAEFLHVDSDEVALKLAVSDGFNTVINGMEWREGDQIIATEEEASAILGPSLHLKQTRGVETFKAPMVDDIEGQVSAIADLITDRTRLIAFSHVTTETGFRLPANQICQGRQGARGPDLCGHGALGRLVRHRSARDGLRLRRCFELQVDLLALRLRCPLRSPGQPGRVAVCGVAEPRPQPQGSY